MIYDKMPEPDPRAPRVHSNPRAPAVNMQSKGQGPRAPEIANRKHLPVGVLITPMTPAGGGGRRDSRR